MNHALTILRHFTDPEAPERVIARAMLQGRSNDLLRGAAADLAMALGDQAYATRHTLDVVRGRITDAARAFREAGEECGIVPVERAPAGRVLVQ